MRNVPSSIATRTATGFGRPGGVARILENSHTHRDSTKDLLSSSACRCFRTACPVFSVRTMCLARSKSGTRSILAELFGKNGRDEAASYDSGGPAMAEIMDWRFPTAIPGIRLIFACTSGVRRPLAQLTGPD